MNIKANSIEELISLSNNPALMQELFDYLKDYLSSEEPYLIKTDTITLIGFIPLDESKLAQDHNPWPLIALAPQKNNVSLYFGGMHNEVDLLKPYTEYFTKSMMGKGCLRFRTSKQLNYEIISKIIDDCLTWYYNKN
ncbi:MAG: DUF1801 domain-containing protein [Bacilli bacterium]